MNIIETQNLSHRYWRTEAVQNLNLAVPTGSVFALLGPNGAGKTTTIKMLVNLLRPTAGEARVLCVDGAGDGAGDFWALLRKGADAFATVDTAADDPASSASRRAPPALPRARCTPIACCSDTCRAQKCSMISFPSAATCTGLQPTGPGSRG